MVLVAPFANMELLTRTYSVAGTIHLLSLVAVPTPALAFLNKFILSKWPSKDKLSAFIRRCESLRFAPQENKYDITVIHAEDENDIPWMHSDIVFWHAVTATQNTDESLSFEELELEKDRQKRKLGSRGLGSSLEGSRGGCESRVIRSFV